VLEGNGAYTAVDGERTLMRPGDFIITPYMAWHDHGNDTDEPIFWLDGLDIPLIQFLDASFLDRLDEDEQPIGKPEGYSMARYGANLLPVDQNGRTSATSPIFNYPYDRTREALHQLAKAQKPDACHGIKMRYSNPITAITPCRPWAPSSSSCRAGSARRAIAPRMPAYSWPWKGAGARGSARPCSNGVPRTSSSCRAGRPVVHEADEEAVLFSFSDRPVQEKSACGARIAATPDLDQ
jgi:gentisate 1,2-dioxygenase